MNVRRFTARTTREAMALVRAELGADAIVLKNHAVPGGVEIIATIDLPEIDAAPTPRPSAKASTQMRAQAPARVHPGDEVLPSDTSAAPVQPEEASAPAQAMSTLTFQQYVRDRLARRQAEAAAAARSADAPAIAAKPMVSDAMPAQAATAAAHLSAPGTSTRPAPALAEMLGAAAMPVQPARPAVQMSGQMPAQMATLMPADAAAGAPMAGADLMAELRAIASQLSSLTWMEGVRRNPLQLKLLRRMVGAGYSTTLARKLAARLPSDFSPADAERWMSLALSGLLNADSAGDSLLERGGIYALVGPTGVGKTTTAAKMAAQFAMRHGAQSVGLITVDAYRIGGQDQLRTYGRLLGVPVHVAYDAATLAEFLHLFMNKKLVIVDTVGIGQRDERLGELLSSLSSINLRRLLVLNAAAQAETLEDVVHAYRGRETAGVVISKLDEAVKTGGVLDCVMRHRMRVVGVANGQRVPEDWGLPDPKAMVEESLRQRAAGAFDLDDGELALMLGSELDVTAGALASERVHA